MKTKLLFLAIFGAMALTACNNDNVDSTQKVLNSKSVIASLPTEGSSRTEINNELKVLWSTNDKISVFAELGDVYTNFEGDIKSGVGTTDALFDFDDAISAQTKVVAVYPYYSTTTFDGTDITITLPESYEYVENGIGGAPMAAFVSGDNAIAFKNAGALIGATIENIPAGYDRVTLTSSTEALTGECKIVFTDGIPTLKAPANGGKTITITFDADTKASTKTFYFPLPVQEYTELELSISDGTQTKVLKSAPLNAIRNVHHKSVSTITTEVVGTDAATQALEGGNNSVAVTVEESEVTPTVTLPESDNTKTSLSFEAIPSGKTVTIEATTPTAAVSESVAITAATEQEDNNNFVINLPKSTVTLQAAGAPTTYNKVTAKTAANTLILGENVTVKTLIIEGGNVRVIATATIEAISRSNENADAITYIIYENGATIPQELGENIVALTVDEYQAKQQYATEFIAAIAQGGEVVLAQNIELPAPIVIAKENSVTLDLNGYTISQKLLCEASYNMITNNGTLVIKDSSKAKSGKISFEELGESGGMEWGSYTIYNSGTLEVYEGTIEHLGAASVGETNIPIQNYKGKVTIYGGTFNSPEFRSLRDFTAGGEIDIKGGIFIGQVWMQGLGNGSSKLTISGGEFMPQANDGSSVFITNSGNDVIVDIQGGKFNTKIGTSDPTRNGVKGCISGGIFTDSAKENTNVALLAEGNEFVANDDATFTWKVDISEEQYIANFIAAVAQGGEVTMAKDIELAEPIVINNEVTLDLNGHTISGVCNNDQDHLIMVQNGATLNVKDNSNAKDGKITFARGSSDTGWTITVYGTLNLYSGTLELTGDNWNIGYVADVRPNAWGTAYTAPSTFNMYGGKVVSADGGLRVASSSSDTYTNISANFNMTGGEIEAGWDGIFIQQSNAIYDILNVTITDGTINAVKYPVRLYGPVGTSVVGDKEVATTLTISGGSFGKVTTDATSLIEGMLYYGGGIGNNTTSLPFTKINISGCTCGGENVNFTFGN